MQPPLLDDTHDPAQASWVPSAQRPGGDFPLQNLPHGVFRRHGSAEPWRGGVAIGDEILDLQAALAAGLFGPGVREAAAAAAGPTLNPLMALGPAAWRALRLALWQLLRADSPQAALAAGCLVPQAQADMALPAAVGEFADFFSSWHHMVNAGRIFQPDAPPLPNFRWLPIAYHGRASTVAVSGTPVRRPWGQTRAPGTEAPVHAPVQRLDHELELALWVGPCNAHGQPVPVADAEGHLFGVGLLNDWSARDVQAWESMPLGPFLAKNFHTSVSPWIVTLQALAPYRCALPRTAEDPPTLPHLQAGGLAGIDIQLQALLCTAQGGAQEMPISRSSFRHAYWAPAQMLAHHTEGGCALRPGDLLGTGTQSGPADGEQGCLLELTQGGRRPLKLPSGERRLWLQDGDTVVLRAWCERPGAARIGFGECRGTVLPAWPEPAPPRA